MTENPADHDINQKTDLTQTQQELLTYLEKLGPAGINFRDIADFFSSDDMDKLIESGLVFSDETGMLSVKAKPKPGRFSNFARDAERATLEAPCNISKTELEHIERIFSEQDENGNR